MRLNNKLQTLLTDLLDKALRRQWHVRCADCVWEVHNLEHERFARRRGQLHHNSSHLYKQMAAALNNEPIQKFEVWHSRA